MIGGIPANTLLLACNLVNPADVTGLAAGKNWCVAAIGADRYETAREVFNNCKREGVPLTNVVIATGSSPVDSIPGAALKCPILLVDPGKTSAAVGRLSANRDSISRLLVLGGTGTVSDATAATLANALK